MNDPFYERLLKIAVIFIVGSLMLFWASHARAEFITGNKLYELCQSTNSYDQGACHGYIAGVFDSDQRVMHCAPLSVTLSQVKDIVMKVLREAPELRNQTADVIIAHALKALYPCKEQSQPGVRPITM